jgi:hypothetical protein
MFIFPFGVPSFVPPSDLFRSRLPYLGFFPLRDVTGAVHSTQKHTRSCYVPPTDFLSLSTVCSDYRLRGLIPSHNRVQGFPFRGFSRPAASLTHRQFVPSWRCNLSAHRRPKPSTPLPGPSPTGSCSADRSVLPVRCLASPSVAPLFGFFLLQAFAGPP